MTVPQEIQQLAVILRMTEERPHFTFNISAIESFRFFHKLSKERVIDTDWLEAILRDAGVKL